VNTSIPLSVLIVTYHSEKHIGPCLGSLIPQVDLLQGEIILVDNASGDKTLSIVEQYFRSSGNTTLIRNQRNLGFAAANNQALAVARGETVLLLNPDTVITDQSLLSLMQTLASDMQLGAVAPQLRFPDGRIQRSCRRFPTYWNIMMQLTGLAMLFPMTRWANGWKMGDFAHDEAREVHQPAAAALMIRGRLLRDLKGFDTNFPMFFNDVDLCKRIHGGGYRIRFEPACWITHVGGGSVKERRIRMIISSQLSFFRYFEKHYTGVHYQVLNLLLGLVLYIALIPRILLALLDKGGGSGKDTL